jgi:hypothetical protein
MKAQQPEADKLEVEKFFNCRVAIVEMGLGETKEDAWTRHLAGHPDDFYADIKIFNRDSRFPAS